uniref:Uncharacterized protein n=1 Tax=Pseudomonas graminis TaxID=158627 RepID=A0A7C2B9Y7_9PSED
MNAIDPGLIATCVMGLMFLSLIILVITTCVARRRIDTLLSRCTVVADHKATFGGLGFMGDVIRVGTVCTILLIPKAYARKNFIDEEQVQEFPSGLRFLIVSTWSLIFIAAFALVALRFYMYLNNIHPSGR